jgi:hypothetical protein
LCASSGEIASARATVQAKTNKPAADPTSAIFFIVDLLKDAI